MDLEMRSFIRWQLNQEKRGVYLVHLVMMLISFFVFVFYKLAKGVCFQLVALMTSIPEEVCAFLGVGKGAETGNIGFFLGSTMAVMSAVLILLAVFRTARIAYRDDKNGMLFLMLNQWYSREQLFHARFAVAVITFAAGYAVWFLELIILALLGSLNSSQRLNNIGLLFQVMLGSICVGIFLISATFFWLYCSKEKVYKNMQDMAVSVMAVSLLFGNIYKVRDLIVYFMAENDINPIRFSGTFRFLDYLVYFSPLSWINPYRERGIGMFFLEIFLCAAGSAGLFLLTNGIYKKCSFLH